ncbi:MAG TPA: hypothetical protein PK358_10705 [Spirochaetota bacterium]|nr:hypothetical protein [Spirochaetota bacterium]HPJ35296.1 hypothetical protein [Spirochaetota bacterium]
MKKMLKRREEYFPLFDLLLEIYGRRAEYEFPMRINDSARIALILELIDIGYLDFESFIVKKTRGEINALYYTGGYPLSKQGLIVHRSHLHALRGRYIKIAAALSFLSIAALLYYMIIM